MADSQVSQRISFRGGRVVRDTHSRRGPEALDVISVPRTVFSSTPVIIFMKWSLN